MRAESVEYINSNFARLCLGTWIFCNEEIVYDCQMDGEEHFSIARRILINLVVRQWFRGFEMSIFNWKTSFNSVI